VVQVNGKVRDRIALALSVLDAMDNEEAEISQWVLDNSERLNSFLEGKTISRKIYVPRKLMNFVVR